MYSELAAILAASMPHEDDAVKLADVLYERCYTHSILDPWPPAESASDEDLTAVLMAANRSRPTWDEGWRVDQLLDHGRILARKNGAARSFLPGEYLTHRGLGAGPKAEKPVSIFLPAGSVEMQPDFYYAFGETAGEFEESERTLRFYWNVSGEGAPHLMEVLTRELNRFQIAFHFKCGNRAAHYSRRDAAVLYVHARSYSIVALLMEQAYEHVETWLRPETPLFVRPLAPGLGFAECPGESFGKQRCRILAEAMSATRGVAVDERMLAVRGQFERRGLSMEKPWLNAGSLDAYEFPLTVA